MASSSTSESGSLPVSSACKAQRWYDSQSRRLNNEGEKMFTRFARTDRRYAPLCAAFRSASPNTRLLPMAPHSISTPPSTFLDPPLNVLWTVLAWVKTLLLRTPSMNRSFIILSSGRSGSTMLVQLLNCHPAILCHSELLNRDDLKGYGLIREGRPCVSSHRLIKYTMAQLVPWKPWLPYTGLSSSMSK